MQLISQLFEIFFHLDVYLAQLAEAYGVWIYAILFLVLFAETGLVVTPFLPGDSLLLTAGVLASSGILDIRIVMAVCLLGPIIGDSTNYWIGRLAGAKLIASGRFVKREYVDSTAAFFERHGGKTITIARFFPIIRTFAPFMAGVGKMDYRRFVVFSVVGTFVWVGLFVGAGYLFGQIEWVAENLEIGVMIVLALSLVPAMVHFVQSRIEARSKPAPAEDLCEELDEIEHAVAAAEGREPVEADCPRDQD